MNEMNENNTMQNRVNDIEENGLTTSALSDEARPVAGASIDGGSPLKDKLLLKFISIFTTECIRKLRKYRRICLRLEDSSSPKANQIFTELIQAISIADKAASGEGISPIVAGSIRQAFNRLDIFYSRRKASKVTKALSIQKGERGEKFDYRRFILIILIVGCDICRMYHQQIKFLYLGRHDSNLYIFVKDCVDRIVRDIFYRQGTIANFSGLLERHVYRKSGSNTAAAKVDKIRKYKDIENVEQMKEIAKYIIQGLAKRAKRKVIRRHVSGRQLQVMISGAPNKDKKKLKISSNNLLHRTFIKHNDKYYFSNRKDWKIKRLVAKLPGRLINHRQDKISKLCGYSLSSIIDPELIRKKVKLVREKKIKNIFKNSDENNDENLINIGNFDELMTLAKSLYNFYKFEERLEKFCVTDPPIH